jgi:hypothetical protein
MSLQTRLPRYSTCRRILHGACCVFVGRPPRLGTECRSRLSRARLLFFRRPPSPCGSTAFPTLDQFRYSITGRSLRRRLLVRWARNGSALLSLRSFRVHREKATGSVTELCSRNAGRVRDENVAEACRPSRAIHGDTTPTTAITPAAMSGVRGIVDLSRAIIEDGD